MRRHWLCSQSAHMWALVMGGVATLVFGPASLTLMGYVAAFASIPALGTPHTGGALSAVRAQCNYLGIWPY